MIVSKFRGQQDTIAFGREVIKLLKLTADEGGLYDTDMGFKTEEGLARSIERLYRARVYGVETIPEDDRYYAANISGEDPVWPKPKPVDKTDS